MFSGSLLSKETLTKIEHNPSRLHCFLCDLLFKVVLDNSLPDNIVTSLHIGCFTRDI